jgi:uncharacterized membrane protein YhaH (DUF805 family)
LGFGEAIKSVFGKYATFNGRAVRSEYWYFALFSILANIAASIIDAAGGSGVVSGLLALGVFLPSLAVSVRRLHDIDRSGWFLLLLFVPLIGAIILLIWSCQRGTSGPNRFGADPLAGRY